MTRSRQSSPICDTEGDGGGGRLKTYGRGIPGQAIEARAGQAAAEGRLIARPHVGMRSDCQV